MVERVTERCFQFVEMNVLGDGDAEGLLVVQQQEPLVDLAVVEVRLVVNEAFHRRLVLQLLEHRLHSQRHPRSALSTQHYPQLLQTDIHLQRIPLPQANPQALKRIFLL